MFEIYNEQLEYIPLPADELGLGLRGLDLDISSVGQSITEHSMPGWPGKIITGFQDSDREIGIAVRLRAKDPEDYRVKRDRVYSFFKRLGTFYIAEQHTPYKIMKVRVIEAFRFVRPENIRIFATAEIPLTIIGQPYWISRFRSLELQGGIPYPIQMSPGLGLEVDPNKLNYQFTNAADLNVYNAGTVPLKTIQEKDNCIITIDINQAVTNFKLYDFTGRYFEYNPTKDTKWDLAVGNQLVLNGHSITLNNTPILDRTNRYFLQLQPGDNHMRIEGLTSYTITFDFRFKYD